jgi:polysaccharide pyruvyl transferase WcaK-like protein
MPALVAARSGRAVWLLGHTLGPFRSRAGERIAAHVVRRADRVVLREATSLDVARRLGATDPVVAGDMALELRPRRSSKVAAVLERAGVVDRHFAVVTVRRAPYGDVADDDRLGIELIRAMRQLLDDGLVEVVVMVAHVLGPTAVEDDRTATRHLFDHARHVLGTDRVRLVEDDLAPDELAALYGAARLVIGERFHSVLLALAAGTPAYAISYFTRKASGMMHDLGLDEFHCELREADGDRIGRGAVALCDPQTRARVDDAVSHARKTIDGALA